MSVINIDWAAVGKLDNWARNRYLKLINEIGEREFTREEAEEILSKHGLGLENIGKLFSVLRDAGLINVREDKYDSRRNVYNFIFLGTTEKAKAKVNRNELIGILKKAADLIRTSVDYKVILLFLFYKSVSDIYHFKVNQYRAEGYDEEQSYMIVNSEYLKLYDEKEKRLYTWHEVTKSSDTIKELANAITEISKMNEELSDLRQIAQVTGLYGLMSDENRHILTGVVQIFDQYDFSGADYDTLGDGYQWILSYFAPTRAKEGEVYTPREVIKLVVRLLDISDGSKVLDPACGSGGMLIESYEYVKNKGVEPNLELFGQERNEIMAAIAKMNMRLRGIMSYNIFNGDSLLNPKFDHADYVIANPPWNQDGYDEDNLSKDNIKQIYNSIVEAGYTPKTTADWAWVQLMLYYAKKKVGVILDQGALVRGGKEENIRRGIVKSDLLEAVILLPEKLFYNTQAAGIILVFNKEKPAERKGKVIFINASELYIKHPEIRKLNQLSEENITKIVEMYKDFKDFKNYARVVSLDEIEKNSYNLNVSLYVHKDNESKKIDIFKEFEELKSLEEERQSIMEKLENYLEEVKRLNG
ncbi:MAG: class I SAM-dependent DNA methyltransferase [Thermocladium sp.]